MKRIFFYMVITGFIFMVSDVYAQADESPLGIFGYFQTAFQHQKTVEAEEKKEISTFVMQQLNLFLQKDLARDWTSFVDFEVLNNFSSQRQWGAINLEEAWVKYRSSKEFSLKLGLQIPVFNNLNEIKNRTPLLPYIIRPLVYETSLNDAIRSLRLEEYFPSRAFFQVYGFIPVKKLKIDYAFYAGNSPNIATTSDEGQSGVDTTSTALVGGRMGIRFSEIKAGASFTHDKANFLDVAVLDSLLEVPRSTFNELNRFRVGFDLSIHFKKFYFEGEYIGVVYEEVDPRVTLDKQFYYFTVGYNITEKLFVYGGSWLMDEDFIAIIPENKPLKFVGGLDFDVEVNGVGLAYRYNDRLVLKAQYAPVRIKSNMPEIQENIKFNFSALAVSVFF